MLFLKGPDVNQRYWVPLLNIDSHDLVRLSDVQVMCHRML